MYLYLDDQELAWYSHIWYHRDFESHIESIEEVSVVEESVSEKEVEENDEQVQDFAEDEPAEIYVVPEII